MSVVGSIEEQRVTYYQWRGVCSIFRGKERHITLFNATELPPVEVAHLHALSPFKHKVEVVNTCHRSTNVNNFFFPLFPATSVPHFKTCNHLTFEAVNTHLNSTTPQSTCHTCGEGARHFLAKVDSLQLDVVAIMCFRNINTRLIIPLTLHTF